MHLFEQEAGKGSFGHDRKTIRITQPRGLAGIYHMPKDHWHDGITQKVNDESRSHFKGKSHLSNDDILVPDELTETRNAQAGP